jgi:hypothetical protein
MKKLFLTSVAALFLVARQAERKALSGAGSDNEESRQKVSPLDPWGHLT